MRICKVLFFALFCVAGPVLGAFAIDPTIVVFNAAAGEKVVWVEVVNTGGGPVAVELSVFDRVLDLDGELDRGGMKPCNDFVIYPSTLILKPKERASVQIMYRGKERVAADRAYILFSNEVLLPLEEDESDEIRVRLPAVVSYYNIISFETGKEGRLAFVSSRALEDGRIELIVENRSGGRVKTDNLAVKTADGLITDFTGTKNSIMPGQRRRFTFKGIKPPAAKEVKFVY
jgi:P pilus assembly chaperone PapD